MIKNRKYHEDIINNLTWLTSLDFIVVACPNCEHYDDGLCRINPPTGTGFPSVTYKDYCPQFKPSAKERQRCEEKIKAIKAENGICN